MDESFCICPLSFLRRMKLKLCLRTGHAANIFGWETEMSSNVLLELVLPDVSFWNLLRCGIPGSWALGLHLFSRRLGSPRWKNTHLKSIIHGDYVKTISKREGIPISHTKQQIAESILLLRMPRAAIIQDGLTFAATQGPCVLWTLLQNVAPPSGSESEIPE